MEVKYKYLSKHNKIKILVGLPGSGKTTLANEIYQSSDKTRTVIISKDNIRMSLGDYWIPERDNYIRELFDYTLSSALRKGLDIIIDNAGCCFEKHLNTILSVVNKDEYDIELIIVDTDVEECIKRDSLREKGRMVGEKVIREFYNGFKCNKYLK